MKLILTDTAAGQFSLIADSAMTLPGRPTFLPDIPTAASWQAQPLLAIRVSRLGKSIAPKFASRYFDAATTALRLIPLDADGHELTTISSIIDFGLTLGRWIPADGLSATLKIYLDSESAELPDTAAIICAAIASISEYATLKMGDILLLPLPLLRREISVGSRLEMRIGDEQILSMRIR